MCKEHECWLKPTYTVGELKTLLAQFEDNLPFFMVVGERPPQHKGALPVQYAQLASRRDDGTVSWPVQEGQEEVAIIGYYSEPD